MVKGWNAKSCWGFPKGKINESESLIDCAVRELNEEIGFDVQVLLNETDYIEYNGGSGGGDGGNGSDSTQTRLYIVRGVKEETPFAPQTRKEISDIAWHSIHEALNNRTNRYFTARKALILLQAWIKNKENKQNSQKTEKEKKGAQKSENKNHLILQKTASSLLSMLRGEQDNSLSILKPPTVSIKTKPEKITMFGHSFSLPVSRIAETIFE